MNYRNTKEVLFDLKLALEGACGEKLVEENLHANSKSATFKSENFAFVVSFAFIQARVLEDFNQPIEARLKEVLTGFDLGGSGQYELTSRTRGNVPTTEIPIEYCILRA